MRRARNCTSFTSARDAAWRWPPKLVPKVPMFPSKPARTICSSPKRIWSGSALSRSARRRCAVPQEQDALWTQLLAGTVDIVASDHSPAPPEMKTGEFGRAWGGIAGVQSTLAVLLDRGYHCRQLSLEADFVARRGRACAALSNPIEGRHCCWHGCGPGSGGYFPIGSIAGRTSETAARVESLYRF